MAAIAYPSVHYGMSSPSSSPSSPRPSFAFAQVEDEIVLIQLSQPSSSLMVSDIRVYRHEFLTIYRYSHCATVHPSDIHILKPLDDLCSIDEDSPETISLPREIVSRMERLSDTLKFQRLATTSHYRRPSTSAYRTSPITRVR